MHKNYVVGILLNDVGGYVAGRTVDGFLENITSNGLLVDVATRRLVLPGTRAPFKSSMVAPTIGLIYTPELGQVEKIDPKYQIVSDEEVLTEDWQLYRHPVTFWPATGQMVGHYYDHFDSLDPIWSSLNLRDDQLQAVRAGVQFTPVRAKAAVDCVYHHGVARMEIPGTGTWTEIQNSAPASAWMITDNIAGDPELQVFGFVDIKLALIAAMVENWPFIDQVFYKSLPVKPTNQPY